MKNWKSLLELISALGVIISLIYLAIQVNLSTKVAKAELTKELYLASREAIMDIASEEYPGQVWADIREFESVDDARKWAFYQSFFRLYELEYSLAKQDLLDKSIDQSYRRVINMFGDTKDFGEYWSNAQVTFDPEFVAFVDETIQTY